MGRPYPTAVDYSGNDTIESQSPPNRVLVVDDDPDLCQIYCSILTRAGYQVDAAGDGEAGWAALLGRTSISEKYALLITDNLMPKLSGIELVLKIRCMHMSVPVVLAAGTPPSGKERFLFEAVMEKPFTPQQLVDLVETVIHDSNESQRRPLCVEHKS